MSFDERSVSPGENLKDRHGRWSIFVLFGGKNSRLAKKEIYSMWLQRSKPGPRNESYRRVNTTQEIQK